MICLDACVIGHVLIPEVSNVANEEITASRELVEGIVNGDIKACAPSVVISETKWFVGRTYKSLGSLKMEERVDEVEDLLPQALGASFRFVDVDFAIAALAADFRLSYYSKKNTFSYNDGIYLATASLTGCTALVTTDPHLLKTKETTVQTPASLIKSKSHKL